MSLLTFLLLLKGTGEEKDILHMLQQKRSKSDGMVENRRVEI
jgi:hypothetical protein